MSKREIWGVEEKRHGAWVRRRLFCTEDDADGFARDCFYDSRVVRYVPAAPRKPKRKRSKR